MALIDNVQMHATKEYTFTRVQIHGYINVQMHSRQGPRALEAPPLPAFLHASLHLCRDRKNSFFASAIARWCQSCEAHVAQLCCKREAGVLSSILTRKT